MLPSPPTRSPGSAKLVRRTGLSLEIIPDGSTEFVSRLSPLLTCAYSSMSQHVPFFVDSRNPSLHLLQGTAAMHWGHHSRRVPAVH